MDKKVLTTMDNTCVICFEDIQNGGTTTSCGHLYHNYCLKKWVMCGNRCPLCRTDMGECCSMLKKINENSKNQIIHLMKESVKEYSTMFNNQV